MPAIRILATTGRTTPLPLAAGMRVSPSPCMLLCAGLAASPASAQRLFTGRFVAFDAGKTPYAMASADVDRDGRTDLVVADYASNTSPCTGAAETALSSLPSRSRAENPPMGSRSATSTATAAPTSS